MILTIIKTIKLGILTTFFLAVYYLYHLYGPLTNNLSNIGLIALSYTLTMIIVFTVNNITDKKEDKANHRKTSFNKQIILLSLILLLITFFYIERIFWFSNILALLLGIIYSLRIKGTRIKEITLLKNVYITIIGSSLIVLPLASLISTPQGLIYITWPILFTVILVTDIIWDVKDYKGDKKNKIRTIPVVLGIEKTKTLLGAICLLLSIIEIVLLKTTTLFLPLVLFTIIFINEKRSYWYYECMYYLISGLLIFSIIQI